MTKTPKADKAQEALTAMLAARETFWLALKQAGEAAEEAAEEAQDQENDEAADRWTEVNEAAEEAMCEYWEIYGGGSVWG
jgi:hypothetical protein